MFGGPPEGAEVTWQTHQVAYRILDDGSDDISPVVGHAMVKYKNALIVWGGYYNGDENDFRYRSPTFLYILPAGVLIGSNTMKWIMYHVPCGDVPPSCSGSCAVLCGHRIFLFGGYVRRTTPNNTLEGHSSAMYALDMAQERWTLMDTDLGSLIPTPRDKMAGWCYKEKCYYFGGYGPRAFDMPDPALYLRDIGDFVADESSAFYWNNQLLIFDPGKRKRWSLGRVGGTIPSARAACSSTYLEQFDNILLFGGRNRNRRLNDLYLLDLHSLVWTQVDTVGIVVPEGRTWCSLNTMFPNQALMFGGYSNREEVLSDMWRLEVRKVGKIRYLGKWTAVNVDRESKSPRLWHTGAIVEGQLLICGGTDSMLGQGVRIRGILKRRLEPLSLQTICLAAVVPYIKEVDLLPPHLQQRCAWARYILSWGYQSLNMDIEYFRMFKLLDILNMCS